MGNTSSMKGNESNTAFREEEWVEESRPQSKELGDYRTLKNINTDELIDQYEVLFSSEQDYQNYL